MKHGVLWADCRKTEVLREQLVDYVKSGGVLRAVEASAKEPKKRASSSSAGTAASTPPSHPESAKSEKKTAKKVKEDEQEPKTPRRRTSTDGKATPGSGKLKTPGSGPSSSRSIKQSVEKTSEQAKLLIQKALATPLPKLSSSKKTTRTSRRAVGRGLQNLKMTSYMWGSLVGLIIVALGILGHINCKDRVCVNDMKNLGSSVQGWTTDHASQAWTSVSNGGRAAWSAADTRISIVFQSMNSQFNGIKERTIDICDSAWEFYRHFLSMMWSNSENATGAIDVIDAMQHRHAQLGGDAGQFHGKLNKSVLKKVLRADEGKEWITLRQSMEEVWNGGSLAGDKANVVLFVCDSPTSCGNGLEELSAAASKESTFILSVSEIMEMELGEIQRKVATFLIRQPYGVVIISGKLDLLPPSSISVLNNAMSESGSLYRNGKSVTTTSATFFYIWEVPKAIIEEGSAAGLNVAAKGSLNALLRSQDDSESKQNYNLPDLFWNIEFISFVNCL